MFYPNRNNTTEQPKTRNDRGKITDPFAREINC